MSLKERRSGQELSGKAERQKSELAENGQMVFCIFVAASVLRNFERRSREEIMQDMKGVMYNEGCIAEQIVKQQICFYKNSLLFFVCNRKE